MLWRCIAVAISYHLATGLAAIERLQCPCKMEPGADSVYIEAMVALRQKLSKCRITTALVVGLVWILGSSTASAQRQPPRMPKFEAEAPKVGEQLPDITIHDDLGNPVNIRDLASENYKVLVLGCLT